MSRTFRCACGARGFDEDTWFTFSYSPVRDDADTIAGFYCACTETTKGVLAQKQLRAREEWLLSLFHRAPGFAAVLRGPQHVFEMVNEAYHRITGNRPLLGLPVAQALPEIVGQGFGGWLDEVFATGQPFVGESIPVTVNRGPGTKPYEAFVDFMYQPLRDASGRVEGIFVHGHDVTQQHRAQQALRDADRQKDEFLATLAHELRNPLAPIRTAAHLLETSGATDAIRARAVDIIGRQVGHMSRLLDDLIDIARITQRRLVLKKEDVRLGTIVEAAVETARPLAEAKGHTIAVDVPTPDATLNADAVRLTQVLTNLLNNAVKYTDPGGRIALEATVEEGVLRVSVSDSGIGLDADAMANLFVMFAQQADALERSEGGLGIGLALVRGLVELHGGTVSAASEGKGRGSRFTVEMPAVPVGAGTHPQSTKPAVARTSRSVLVADDNHDAAELLAEWLRLSGYTVHIAGDGTSAARMAMELRPDVAVLDIGMPGLNGYEVAQRIRSQEWGRHALLVAATGWGQDADRLKATDAGFDAHLTKPFDPDDLAALIERHCA